MANQSIYQAFERMWTHVLAKIGAKADLEHTHNDLYYTETEIDAALETKSDLSHTHDLSAYETKIDASSKLDEAKSYADSAAIDAAANVVVNVKNDLLNGADEAHNTLKKLGTLIDENQDAIDELDKVVSNKSDKGHIHEEYATKVYAEEIVGNKTAVQIITWGADD